jgi:3-dehydroquinate synthase
MVGNSIKLLSCNSLNEVSHLLPKEKRVIVIIDSNIKAIYGKYFPFPHIEVIASEKEKSLSVVADIARKLMDIEADRDTFLLAVGGGITTDIAAFTASIYFRGVDFALVPTTLLSQVDAAIGGKNGVNLDGYKNVLGVIKQPLFTLICPQFLKTLPQSDIKGGLAEMLKTLIIKDREGYCMAASLIKRGYTLEELAPYIQKAAEIKAAIVEGDMYEKGERKLLNLGHTFAHAIEKESGVPHGEAVAIGIILAARLSVKLNILDSREASAIEEDFIKIGLETKSPLKPELLFSSMKRDKKRSGDTISFILIERIGKCVIYPVQIARLEEALYDLS